MYYYIKGTINYIDINYIVLDNNGIGYMIYVPNPYNYKIGDNTLVYVYEHIREEEDTLYGFKSMEEKDLFLKLISVKGLGPKMALVIFSDDIKNVYNAIENSEINYLKKFPKIGDKVARQIILDLKGKLKVDDKDDMKDLSELTETLKSLGYKKDDIKRISKDIDANLSIEKQIKQALKLLAK